MSDGTRCHYCRKAYCICCQQKVIEAEMRILLKLGVMHEREVRAAMVRVWEAAQS